MDDIIKAMRVLAEELENQCKILIDEAKKHQNLILEIGAATFVAKVLSDASKKSADRLERESKNPGADEI